MAHGVALVPHDRLRHERLEQFGFALALDGLEAAEEEKAAAIETQLDIHLGPGAICGGVEALVTALVATPQRKRCAQCGAERVPVRIDVRAPVRHRGGLSASAKLRGTAGRFAERAPLAASMNW